MHVHNLLNGLGNGWFVAPKPAIAPITTATSTMVAPRPTSIPFYDPAQLYTRDEIQEMMAARKAAQAEITAAQNSQGGDGVAEDLEQIANEQNATDAAIAAGGTGLPVRTGAGKPNIAPLAILGALAYFLL